MLGLGFMNITSPGHLSIFVGNIGDKDREIWLIFIFWYLYFNFSFSISFSVSVVSLVSSSCWFWIIASYFLFTVHLTIFNIACVFVSIWEPNCAVSCHDFLEFDIIIIKICLEISLVEHVSLSFFIWMESYFSSWLTFQLDII